MIEEDEIIPPAVIAAISCRLRGDIKFGVIHSIPKDELLLILDIVDAAGKCVSEWVPNPCEKRRGCGTGVGMHAAEDALIRCVKTKI